MIPTRQKSLNHDKLREKVKKYDTREMTAVNFNQIDQKRKVDLKSIAPTIKLFGLRCTVTDMRYSCEYRERLFTLWGTQYGFIPSSLCPATNSQYFFQLLSITSLDWLHSRMWFKIYPESNLPRKESASNFLISMLRSYPVFKSLSLIDQIFEPQAEVVQGNTHCILWNLVQKLYNCIIVLWTFPSWLYLPLMKSRYISSCCLQFWPRSKLNLL